MLNVMVDLETMGNGPQAAIIAIGAVEFTTDSSVAMDARLGREFYEVIDLADAVRNGGVIDASTVMWWMQQSDEARVAFARGGLPIKGVLSSFAGFLENCASPKDVRIWGNGATFDNVILASAYRNCGMKQPWMYFNDRCYRTVKAMYPTVTFNRTGTAHNALDDAKSQATHLCMLRAVL